MKTFKDEQYVVIKAYRFTVFEFLRDFLLLLLYCASVLSLCIESSDSITRKVKNFHIPPLEKQGITCIFFIQNVDCDDCLYGYFFLIRYTVLVVFTVAPFGFVPTKKCQVL